jgi:hypothetical protein
VPEVELRWERLFQQAGIVEFGEGDAEGVLVERDSELLLGEAPELGEGAVPVAEVPDDVADVVEVVDVVDLLVVDENLRTGVTDDEILGSGLGTGKWVHELFLPTTTYRYTCRWDIHVDPHTPGRHLRPHAMNAPIPNVRSALGAGRHLQP